jgi:hypothetical protein
MSEINKWTSCGSTNIEINKLAGCGGTKTVYYIDDSNKNWVIATPNIIDGEQMIKYIWPRIVKEELHLSNELKDLNIPCLHMEKISYTLKYNNTDYTIPILKMKSFLSYAKDFNIAIMDIKNISEPISQTIWDKLFISSNFSVDKLVYLLTPLVEDLNVLALNGIKIGPDALNWQIQFEDSELTKPKAIRVFLFDLTSKRSEKSTLLSSNQWSYEETKFKLVNHYFNYIFPQKSSENLDEVKNETINCLEKKISDKLIKTGKEYEFENCVIC